MDQNKIIDDLGGTSVVAGLCEVTTGAVSQWRHDGIPPARLKYLRLLRPDVFRLKASEADQSELRNSTNEEAA